MKTIDADFNDLVRGGKVRVLLSRAGDVQVGESVILVESEEDMRLTAHASEMDEKFVYFALENERSASGAWNASFLPTFYLNQGQNNTICMIDIGVENIAANTYHRENVASGADRHVVPVHA